MLPKRIMHIDGYGCASHSYSIEGIITFGAAFPVFEISRATIIQELERIPWFITLLNFVYAIYLTRSRSLPSPSVDAIQTRSY